MITSEVLRILARGCPNYHLVSARFVKDHFSICPCAACASCDKQGGNRVCSRVAADMKALGCDGHAIVNALGTCDAARFVQKKFDDFKLEAERVKLPPKVAPVEVVEPSEEAEPSPFDDCGHANETESAPEPVSEGMEVFL